MDHIAHASLIYNNYQVENDPRLDDIMNNLEQEKKTRTKSHPPKPILGVKAHVLATDAALELPESPPVRARRNTTSIAKSAAKYDQVLENVDDDTIHRLITENIQAINNYNLTAVPAETHHHSGHPIARTIAQRKPQWQEDSACVSCNGCRAEFHTFKRRHHCRNCGAIFCSKCCYQKVPMPHLYDGPQLACTPCAELFLGSGS